MSKTLLVIEDDQTTRKIYLDRFTSEGFNVITTPTGEEGFGYAVKKKPDIILLDILLPGKTDGFAVLKKLKESSSVKNIPVVIMTNVELEKAVALELGAVGYFVKAENSLEDIVNKVKELVTN